MANHTGVDGLVTVGGVTVAELTGFSYDESANTIPNNNLNSTSESKVAGRTNWAGSIDVNWDETDTTGQGAMTIGASISVVFKPEGATTGDTIKSGTAIIAGVSMSVADDAIITKSFSLEGVGALVEGTHA